jgi:RNA polymerase sigma-70 factor (ECF subfamily)
MLNQTSPPIGEDTCDNELAHRIQARDEAAFELLYTRYDESLARHVRGIVRSEVEADVNAQDLVQETFLRVWTRAEQWSGQGSFKSWLYRIATNLALNHLRANRRHPSLPFASEEYRPSDEWAEEQESLAPGWLVDTSTLGPPAALEQDQERARLSRAIEGLSEEKREVLRLVHEMELSIRDTAGRLGIPEGTVKSRLHYAEKCFGLAWNELDTDQRGET